MIDRETLSGEHRELSGLVALLLDQTRSPNPDRPAVASLRWKLSRTLSAHLAKEDLLLYPN